MNKQYLLNNEHNSMYVDRFIPLSRDHKNGGAQFFHQIFFSRVNKTTFIYVSYYLKI